MNSSLIIKYLAIAAIFAGISLVQSSISIPASSQQQLKYQEYYAEQTRKPSLSERDFEDLQNKSIEFLDMPIQQDQIKYVVATKALFAFIFLAVTFVSYIFILKGTTLIQALFVSGISVFSIFWTVSAFELIIYTLFIGAGAIAGFTYNRRHNLSETIL